MTDDSPYIPHKWEDKGTSPRDHSETKWVCANCGTIELKFNEPFAPMKHYDKKGNLLNCHEMAVRNVMET